jgi:uncharacterized membrane protein
VNSPAQVGTAASPGRASRRLATAFSIGYPITAHIAVARESVALTAAAIMMLASAALIPAVFAKQIGAWIAIGLIAIGCAWLAEHGTDVVPLFFPAIVVPAFLLWLFGHTLLAGRTPLIARIVRLTHPRPAEIEPAVLVYARKLTIVWTVIFVAITTINFTLAAFSEPRGLLLAIGVHPPITVPMELWSWFANLASYLFVATFFLLEYAYRKRRFPDQPFRNFFDFLSRCIAVGPHLLNAND